MAIIDCLIFRHHQSHSHQIQRQCIAKYLNCKESAIHISRIGKPILTSHPSTHFSVSHTNTYYFICFSNSPIGCDIESKNRPISDRVLHRNNHSRTLRQSRRNKLLSVCAPRLRIAQLPLTLTRLRPPSHPRIRSTPLSASV